MMVPEIEIKDIIEEWSEEINEMLQNGRPLCMALFSTNRELIYASDAMASLFKENPSESFINPTFENLLAQDRSESPIFKGYLTLGDYKSVNTSVHVHVYRKGDKLLVIGGVDAAQLLEQNKAMHQLNREINSLQRQLIKEKRTLERTLEQLSESNRELEETNAAKDKFFSIISHDLRNPLHGIIGFSEELTNQIREGDYEGIEENAGYIHQLSRQSMELLSNLIEWSRSQTGRMEYRPEQIQLAAMLDETTQLFEHVAGSKSISIKKVLPHDMVLHADRAMMSTVLRNLLSNAIKYTRHGGTITIEARKKQNEIVLSVRDNGVGIPKDRIETLFQLTQNTSTSGTKNEKGTGLGLVLCKELIEKQNGRMWFESEEHAGSTFYVSLSA